MLEKVQNQQVDLKLIIVIGLIIVILITYLKYATKSIAEGASSKKSIAQYESNLREKVQTQMGCFFRDESDLNNLLTYLGKVLL